MLPEIFCVQIETEHFPVRGSQTNSPSVLRAIAGLHREFFIASSRNGTSPRIRAQRLHHVGRTACGALTRL
jgi:hypothetical protein